MEGLISSCMLDLYRQKSRVMPMQWVKSQPDATMTEQWVRLVLEGGQLRIKLGYKSKFRDVKPVRLSRFFSLLRCFWKSFALQNLKKIYTLAICCWSEILHLITKHVWEALWSWWWWHSFQYLVISYKKGTGWTPLISFLRPLITSAILAAVWREIKTRVGYFKQLMHFFFYFFFFPLR